MNNRCVIVAGGDCDTKRFCEISATDFVIVADSGLKYSEAVGLTPDLIVGDFVLSADSKTFSFLVDTALVPTKI